MAKAVKESSTPPQFLYGFTDLAGKVQIEPIFEIVGEFEKGKDYTKAKQGGKWGIISRSGQWKFEPRFEFIDRIIGDHVKFRVGNLWGLSDLNGKEIVKAEFDEIVSVGRTVFSVRQGTEFKILDFNLKEIKTGLEGAFPWNDGFSIVVQNEEGGMIDETGKWLIPPGKDPLYDFSEGLAAFEKNGLSGYYDLAGKVAIQPQFQEAYDFSEGLARVKMNDKYGYIDKTGKVVIACEWEDPMQIRFSGNTEKMTRFVNGYAMVAKEDPELDSIIDGYIDRKGQWHEPDSLPEDPHDHRDLKSFRLENPEWIKRNEEQELGPSFEKNIERFRKKLELAREKDEEAAAKVAKEIASHEFDKDAHWVRMTVYDLNNYGLVVTPVNSKGEEYSPKAKGEKKFFETERFPFKNVAKLVEKDQIMDPPRTRKGIELLNTFIEEYALENLKWFADVWNKNGGKKISLPAFIQNEDADFWLDLKTKKKITEADIKKSLK